MQNISGFGFSAQILASKTFPAGFTITQFADDADPLDVPDLTVGDTAMGLNGDFLVWNKPTGIEVAFAIIASTDDDKNLEALLDANRVGKNKSGARDEVSVVLTYPDGSRANCGPGIIVVGPGAKSVSSQGRYKSRIYRFRFESISKSNTPAA